MTWAAAMMVGPNIGVRFYAANPALFWLCCGSCGLVAALIIRMRVKSVPAANTVHCGASV
jgi:hypothetical protein